MGKKEKIQIAIIGVILVGIFVVLFFRDFSENERIWIARPESGSEETKVLLKTEEQEKIIALEVGSRERTLEELEAIYTETIQYLENLLNPDGKEEIILTESISLPQYIEKTGAKIHWGTSDEDVLKSNGTVQREGLTEEREVFLQARITFQDEIREHWFAVKVPPYVSGSKEALLHNAGEELQKLEKETMKEEGFYLPEKIGAVEVSTPESKVSVIAVLVAIVLLLPVLVVVAKRQEKEKAAKERESVFLSAYPQVITKLTLYVGAGMSLRGAWDRLATEYRKRAETSEQKDMVYEEVLVLVGELKNGRSEAVAYEAFGRRIDLKPYVRLATLMISQLQKGSGGLRESLEAEVRLAWEKHREEAVKRGEEAQTKLLLPMMGMLFLVLAIVMIPAFFNMGV